MRLQYKTRGMSAPGGKPKVYFSCHPADFRAAFPLLSEDILRHSNCAVWYDADHAALHAEQGISAADIPDEAVPEPSGADPGSTEPKPSGADPGSAVPEPSGADPGSTEPKPFGAAPNSAAPEPIETDPAEFLQEMQLLVLAVTSRFLDEENRAKDLELPLALKYHIPVLPIMLENGLGYRFSNTCAKIQVVRKYETDPTVIPYEEVLQTFLDSVLVGDELAQQVRDAFDAYVFLSYRKKDRKHAQRLMRLIHENRQFRDIAIWYDEFLVPGEGFNEAIKDAFRKSSLFAMAVTPHLEEKGNYVMRVEYPMARDRKKKSEDFEVVPVEMYEPEDGEEGIDWRIDQTRLQGQEDFAYQEITDLQDEHRPKEMNQSFLDALKRIARKENDGSSRHRFFIGLAYLNGIDVEVDHDRALKLLTEAAKDRPPCMEATEKLADMYLNGEGVRRDTARAIFWQELLARQYKTAYDENHDPDEHKGYGTSYFKALRRLSDMQRDAGKIQAAIDTAKQALSFCEEELEAEVGKREQQRDRALILNRLGSLYREQGELDPAQDCFFKASKIYERQAYEIGTCRARRDLSISFERLGDIYRKKGSRSEADMYYQKTEEIRRQLVQEEEAGGSSVSAGSRRDYSAVLTKLGNVCKSRKQYGQAMEYYTRALRIDQVLAAEVKSPQARDDHGVSLVKVGDIHKAEGGLTEAEAGYEKACGIFRENVEKTGSQFYKEHLAGGCEKLASVKKKLGKKSEAEKLYRESISLREELYRTGETVSAAHALAAACCNAAEFLRDRTLMQKAYLIWKELSIKHPEYAKYRDRAGNTQNIEP